jgi:putative tryptophan/tyrosine transport system substrate-binding protein
MWRSAIWRWSAQCAVAGAMALLAASAAAAQQSSKAYRVGWLSHGSPPPDSNRSVGEFQQGLRDAGYVEGTNLAIVYRYASGKVERLPDLAAELVRLPVDVIVTSGEPAALAAKRATSTIPIVATELVFDPVKAELVASLGRPGGNVTGMATQSEELWPKRLALLKQVVPQLSRVVVLGIPRTRATQAAWTRSRPPRLRWACSSVFWE